MITGAIVVGILIIIFGIYRLATHHNKEGIVEIIVGILEIIAEVLGTLV